MTNEEQLKMYQDLVFANEQMRVNIEQFAKLKDLNILIDKIQKFKNFDENLIIEKLNQIDFEKISSAIFNKIEKSEVKFDELNSRLLKKIDSFENATEGLHDIDSISENFKQIAKNYKTISSRLIYMPTLIVASLVGLFTFFSANLNQYFSAEKIQNESQFAEYIPEARFAVSTNDRRIFLQVPDAIKIKIINGDKVKFIGFEK
ncbi:MAG: hypothetical protein Q7S59_10325 [Sulfurimonas sp.]|nr:hypothetical protein [Sulfurimonas sp.]